MLINHPFGFIGVHITRSGFNVFQRNRNLNIEQKKRVIQKTTFPKTLWLKLYPNEIFKNPSVSLSDFKQMQPKITQIFTFMSMTLIHFVT